MTLDWPLMENNITREDLAELIAFLEGMPILTASANVRRLEAEWSRWLGVAHSVFVNSGSSANMLTLAALRHLGGEGGEVILSPLGWISDVAAVTLNGFVPVFADIDRRTLALDEEAVLERLNERTRAVLLVHAQGFDGLSDRLLAELERRGIPLLEDACESHGAAHGGRKVGSFGLVSNFSFYFAHHMSTIEGGMVCTNDPDIYQTVRMLRGHGLVREMDDAARKQEYVDAHPDLSRDFIFALPGFNMRNTEIGAVLGLSQLRKLDANNAKRRRNHALFIENLDRDKYFTDFKMEGSCNYAFNLVLARPDAALRERVEKTLRDNRVEFRRGSSGGGNQLRQPYLSRLMPPQHYALFPNTEHVHFFGYYIGNYPDLPETRILALCRLLNAL